MSTQQYDPADLIVPTNRNPPTRRTRFKHHVLELQLGLALGLKNAKIAEAQLKLQGCNLIDSFGVRAEALEMAQALNKFEAQKQMQAGGLVCLTSYFVYSFDKPKKAISE